MLLQLGILNVNGMRNNLRKFCSSSSYQAVRRKISNYNQHLTQVGLSDHYTEIIHDRFMKSNEKSLMRKPFLKDTEFIKDRSYFLQGTAEEVLESFERSESKDPLKSILEGIVPVMVRKLALDTKAMDIFQLEDHNILDKLERIQKYLMHLLYQLDVQEPTLCHDIEKTIRRQISAQQDESKEALVLQTRFNNLLEHYRSHYRKQNLDRATIIRSTKSLFKSIRRSPKVAPQSEAAAALLRKVAST